MDKKSVLLSLWQKFVNRFYKSGECEGLMEDVLKPSVSYYEEPKERKGLKERDSLSKTKQLAESVDLFLKSHYDFRYNVLTEETEFRPLSGAKTEFRPIGKRELNTLCMEAHAEGISCWDKDVSRYIYSTQIGEYHPFRLYMDELPGMGRNGSVEVSGEASIRRSYMDKKLSHLDAGAYCSMDGNEPSTSQQRCPDTYQRRARAA